MKISQVSSNIYNLKNQNQNNFKPQAYMSDSVSFSGVPVKPSIFDPVKNAYHTVMNPIEEAIAKGLAWLIQTKPAKKIITATEKNEKVKKLLFSHLIVLGSTLMSGFYVAKTLTNEKLEEQKKQTLAINQIGVFVASTIMAYTFDDMISKKTEKIKIKFKAINKDHPRVEDHLKGIEAAKKIMIFTTMYRFIAPVLVTPLANAIGNKLQAKKEAEMAFGNKLNEK